MDQQLDHWATWLKETRYGKDSTQKRIISADVRRIIRRLLRRVPLDGPMTLLDIGSGDGIVAATVLAQGHAQIQVVVTDISADVLDHARARIDAMQASDRCRFLQLSAESLDGIATQSVDAVVCRASFAYVPDKDAAAREFFRVLKPHGIVSMAEPIMQDDAQMTIALQRSVAQAPETDLFLRLMHRWKAAQFPDSLEAMSTVPLVNFCERDLVSHCLKAGFTDVHLRMCIDVGNARPQTWDAFVDSSPHPLAPPLRWILDTQFSDAERRYFEDRLRPIITSGSTMDTKRIAFLWATKSQAPLPPTTWLQG